MGLSKREKAVLGCLMKGLSNKEIGVALGISHRTVQKHLQRVYYHLGVDTRVEAIVRVHSSNPQKVNGEMKDGRVKSI